MIWGWIWKRGGCRVCVEASLPNVYRGTCAAGSARASVTNVWSCVGEREGSAREGQHEEARVDRSGAAGSDEAATHERGHHLATDDEEGGSPAISRRASGPRDWARAHGKETAAGSKGPGNFKFASPLSLFQSS